MDVKPQTVSKTPFREPSPAISHLLKFDFSHEKRGNTSNMPIRFLTYIKSLRKKVESWAKAMHKIARLIENHDLKNQTLFQYLL